MELQIGDIIYEQDGEKIRIIHKVERLKKTVAICDTEVRFRRKYSKAIKRAGHVAGWDTSLYVLETPELEDKAYRQFAISRLRNYKYENLTTDNIKSLREFLKLIHVYSCI